MTTHISQATVGIIGMGAIGSHAVPLAARMKQVSGLTLTDFDTYSQSNLIGQHIDRRSLGRNKAAVQAGVARRLNPSLHVRAIPARVEDVPLGWLRATVLISAVDSRLARIHINAIARRLGIPLIDVAVNASTGRVRVAVFLPQAEAACLECGMDASDYASLPQVHPCMGSAAATAPTAAPAELGALAAAMAAVELRKLLSEDIEHAAVGRQVIYDIAHHKTFTITIGGAHASCHLSHDNAPWLIRPCNVNPRRRMLGDAAHLLGGHRSRSPMSLSVPGRSLALAATCPACLRRLAGVWLLPQAEIIRCSACAAPTRFLGRDLRDELNFADLTDDQRRLSLAEVGLQSGDVLALRDEDGAEIYLELVSVRSTGSIHASVRSSKRKSLMPVAAGP